MAIFSDFNNSFAVHPVKKDLSLKTDVDSVKQSIKNLILTDRGERLMQPTIGCKIRALLFENFTAQTILLVKTTIYDTINQHEPRAVIEDVSVSADPDNSALNVAVLFSLINNAQTEKLNLVLERIR
tara:strand:+ start:2471 stop:2851 length:381 start_codon:yes stop_codon:yes gene_type:complete